MEPIVVNNEKEFLEAVKNAPPISTIISDEFNECNFQGCNDELKREQIRNRNKANILEQIEKIKIRKMGLQ